MLTDNDVFLKTVGRAVISLHRDLASVKAVYPDTFPKMHNSLSLPMNIPRNNSSLHAAWSETIKCIAPCEFQAALRRARARVLGIRKHCAIHGDIRYSNLLFSCQSLQPIFLDLEEASLAPVALEHAIVIRNLAFGEPLSEAQQGKQFAFVMDHYLKGIYTPSGSSSERLREIVICLAFCVLTDIYYLWWGKSTRPINEKRRQALTLSLGRLFILLENEIQN
jgi:Ser/Thr protein kinase RdoA (MazF antagonist)